jgi:outer membrane receptor for ferrienterochelin and colicin
VLVNATARWQATPALSLVARVENLFDEQYELASTFNTPDRGLYVALRYAPRTGGAAATARATAPATTVPRAGRAAYTAGATGPRHQESRWAID